MDQKKKAGTSFTAVHDESKKRSFVITIMDGQSMCPGLLYPV